jgi:diguanylate cyclase (GGDEF)-like protein
MDIRFRELELLVRIERSGRLSWGPFQGPERDIVAYLIYHGYVNGLTLPWVHDERLLVTALPGESEFERRMHIDRITSLSRILGGQDASLQITHAGRVRISELRQTLRSGRLREQHEVLWDGRHFDMDLRIALADASAATPVSMAYLDLNGFKAVNDTMGHDAGDAAIRAYFHDVAGVLSDAGDAYRLGGDEVGIILIGGSSDDLAAIVRRACVLLQHEALRFDGQELSRLSIAAGINVSRTPSDDAQKFRKDAESSMYKAKDHTRNHSPRPSSLNVCGTERIEIVL